MRAEDSSSASAKPAVFLCGAELRDVDVLRLTLDVGSFSASADGGISPSEHMPGGGRRFTETFLRREYLFPLPEGFRSFVERLFSGDAFFSPANVPDAAADSAGQKHFPRLCLSREEFDAVVFSARIFEAENRAVKYVSAAEHSRFQLRLKLKKKGFSEGEIAPALDFLARRDFLNDRRFAAAWLRSRLSSCINGRAKLAAELAARGVSREDADFALKEFFAEWSEESLCAKAAEKLIRCGRGGDKLRASLLYRGFPASLAYRIAGEAEGRARETE